MNRLLETGLPRGSRSRGGLRTLPAFFPLHQRFAEQVERLSGGGYAPGFHQANAVALQLCIELAIKDDLLESGSFGEVFVFRNRLAANVQHLEDVIPVVEENRLGNIPVGQVLDRLQEFRRRFQGVQVIGFQVLGIDAQFRVAAQFFIHHFGVAALPHRPGGLLRFLRARLYPIAEFEADFRLIDRFADFFRGNFDLVLHFCFDQGLDQQLVQEHALGFPDPAGLVQP